MSRLRSHIALALLTLGLLGGCKVTEPEPPRVSASVPAAFGPAAAADSTSIADKPWREFFNDRQLVGLIDTALQNNLDLQIAVQRVEQARAVLIGARGALLPSVNGVAAAGVDRWGDYTLNGVGNYDTNLSPNIDRQQRIPTPVTPDFFLGLRSSWEIDVWGKLRQRRRAAATRLLATDQGRRVVVTSLVAQVASLYYELLALDGELDVLARNADYQQRALEIIQVQKRAGRATELAVQQFAAQLLRTQGLEQQVRQRIVERENQLNQLLGRYPQRVARGAAIRQQALPDTVAAGVPARALLRRPDVRQAELELAATHADVSAARAAFLPSLTITPYVGLNAYSGSLLFRPESIAFGVLGGLAAPVVNRAPLKADYQRATAADREAFFGYQKALQTGFREVHTNLRGLAHYRRAYALKQQEAASLTRAVEAARDLYVANRANYLEVITAQRSVLDAELEATQLRRDQFLLLIDLYRALGGGWEAAPVTP
ncbi:efflux transporter outer membrane subunit [Hymenobacter sp. CRA2]|uniref:efflux transporter outer membrane subunit n=1 Tax=Hymenobacter sp. CRA2 TaxID=1955620 RepID=UPI00098EFBC9|nr:efflux transporter outer membrane subunit [Hymenobacter sp. CRA2]OON68942.1 RND transporter [Hymenobacter sp. CRA2]